MPALHRAAVALGSNLSGAFDSPAESLREALRRLPALGRVATVSTFHATAPVGFVDQPDFVNAAAVLETGLEAQALLAALLAIETSMGRNRLDSPPKGPRIIDLDLLLYEDRVLVTPALILPHPSMHERRFVLAPLAEIAPGWLHPVLGVSIGQLLARLGPEGAG